MKDTTRKRKKAIRRIEAVHGRRGIINRMYQVFTQGKLGFDAYMKEMGRIMAETIMYIEREELAGPDYRPFDSEIQKWASQGGSIYIGDQKIPTDHPRLRGPKGEIALRSYQRLKAPGGFSEELLGKEPICLYYKTGWENQCAGGNPSGGGRISEESLVARKLPGIRCLFPFPDFG